MKIQRSEARELCSDTEWKLVESSFSPQVETLPQFDLKVKIDRVKKLHRNCTDLVDLQLSDSRKYTTQRKAEVFSEAIGRFEANLKPVTTRDASARPL